MDDGRVARRCRVDPYCPHRDKNFWKRMRMENHLRMHGIHMQIPYLETGRPKKGEERQKSNNDIDIYLNQRRARFYMMDRKLRLAKAAKEERAELQAEHMWDHVLTYEQQANEPSREEYIERSIKTAMAMYMANTSLRVQRTEERISKGYEQQRRKQPCSKDLGHDMRDRISAAKKEEEFEEFENIEVPIPQSPRRQKLPIQRGPKEGTSAAPIFVSSPTGNSPPMYERTFNIHNGFVEVNHVGGSPMRTRQTSHHRLQSKGRFQFHSIVSKLIVTLDKQIVDGIVNAAEACTEIVNLFGMWMENTTPLDAVRMIHFIDALWYPHVLGKVGDQPVDSLFSTVDVSEHMFIFFPIVSLHHWSMFVLFNPKFKELPMLHTTKPTLLYFDSLVGIVNPYDFIPTMHRVMRSLSRSCTDPELSQSLAKPIFEVDFKIFHGPQQPNGRDCGYYAMAYCFYMIEGGLLGLLDPTKWLTEEWFMYEQVEDLRRELHAWCTRTLEM